METTNRPSRPDRLEINDWGDRDDPDDHMETRLKGCAKKRDERVVVLQI